MEGSLFFLLLLLWKQCGAERCSVVERQCRSELGCGGAWHSFIATCGTLLHNKTGDCHPFCRKSIASLLSVQGNDFLTCDCGSNTYCKDTKKRVDICHNAVGAAMLKLDDPDSVVGCSLATMVCNADTSCQTAMDYYKMYCLRMFRGDRCTARCYNSLAVLYRQAKAAKLKTCRCDGSVGDLRHGRERFRCEAVQRHTHELCFTKRRGNRQRHQYQKQTTAPVRTSLQNGADSQRYVFNPIVFIILVIYCGL